MIYIRIKNPLPFIGHFHLMIYYNQSYYQYHWTRDGIPLVANRISFFNNFICELFSWNWNQDSRTKMTSSQHKCQDLLNRWLLSYCLIVITPHFVAPFNKKSVLLLHCFSIRFTKDIWVFRYFLGFRYCFICFICRNHLTSVITFTKL